MERQVGGKGRKRERERERLVGIRGREGGKEGKI